MAGKRRLRGPGGAVFVPHPTVDETTIRAKVEAGEWSEVEEAKDATPAPRKRTTPKK